MKSELCRNRTDRMLGGVCGGIGAFLRIDPTLIRLYFVLLAFFGGIGWLLYLILWATLPYTGEGRFASPGAIQSGVSEITAKSQELGNDVRQALAQPHPRLGVILGAALMFLGALLLLRNLALPWLSWLNTGLIWPLLLIIGGVVLIFRLPREE